MTITGVTVTGTGNGELHSNSTTGLSQTVTAKALTAMGTVRAMSSKVYDGMTTAIPTGVAALQGTETAGGGTTADGKPYSVDAVSTTGTAAYNYNNKNVGSASTVTESGLSLTGTGNSNYTLSAPSLSANITTAIVTVGSGLTANNKVYDGTTTATIGSNNVMLSGVVAGDSANVNFRQRIHRVLPAWQLAPATR